LKRIFCPTKRSATFNTKVVFVAAGKFLQKTHNKTHHFVTFFSISPLFVKKVYHFVKKSTFFCHGQRPNTHFQPNIKGALKPPIPKYTNLHIFLLILSEEFYLKINEKILKKTLQRFFVFL